MAETKGITISFYGDTVEFDRSVDGINNALKKTKNELKEVNKSLKFESKDPEKLQRQFELLNQKQALLKENISLYREELAKLGSYNDLTADQRKQWESIQKQLASAENELKSVNKELDNLKGKDLRDLSKSIEQIGDNLNNIGEKLENVGKKFMLLTGAIGGLATAGIQYNAELERQTALFTTLTGSAEKAEETLRAIKDDALGSPFDVQNLISANQYLMSTGIEADKSRETIMALGNAVAATGGSNSELQRMAQNLQQIQNVGKATTMDIRQFAMAGIDIYGILSESTGKTVEQLQKMDITFDMINDALIEASKEGGKYFGAMDAQSETLNGKLSKLKSTFQALLGELTQVLMPIIKDVIDIMQNIIDKLQNLDDGQKKTIAKIAGIVAGIGPLLTILGKLIGNKGIGGLLKTISNFIKSEKFVSWFGTLSSAISGTGGSVLSFITTIGKMVAPILAVIAVFVTLYQKNEDFRNAVNKLASVLISVLKPAFDLVINVVKSAISIFKSIASTISTIFEPVIKVLGTALSGLINTISSLVSWLGDKLQPIIDLVSAYIKWLDADFKLLAATVKNTVQVVFSDIKKIWQESIDKVKSLIDVIKKLYEKFADTSFGQFFIDMFDRIGGVINKVRGWVSNLTSEINESINKTNQLTAAQDNASRYGGKQNTRAVVQTFDSGGFGMNVNIHVNNNGTPIDVAVVRGWADEISDQVNKNLGRLL